MPAVLLFLSPVTVRHGVAGARGCALLPLPLPSLRPSLHIFGQIPSALCSRGSRGCEAWFPVPLASKPQPLEAVLVLWGSLASSQLLRAPSPC